jgi:hypothetical protein
VQAAFDAEALVRAVERPDSQEGRALDRVVAREAEGTTDLASLEGARAFFEEHRSAAFAWMVDAHFRRVLRFEGTRTTVKGDGVPRAIYDRRDLFRSLLFSVFVGTALVIINVRPGQATGNPADGPDPARIFLNYLVPFLVSSISAALSNHSRRKAAGP